MATIERLNELLSIPVWTYKEILEYFPYIKSKTTAIKIKKKAQKELNGNVKFGSQYVKSESVLSLLGTSREKEIKLLKGITEDEKELY